VTADVVEAASPVVDTARPWPGLDAFTEAQSQFFFGRNAEADELFRRVRRDIATLLFGQSGLGKTSLLQAGLFPRLRWADFLPILIRLDHSPRAPAPAAQVKAVIERAVAAADLSEVTPISAEVSLWGYFHRADRRLADYARNQIVPVLVFDQFEEIFTLGLASDDRRATSQDFLGELADLVENRPPEALEQAIEAEPDLVESFSFDRQDYRIVLALREDFLALLESLRSRAPSLGRNRYRLQPMSGRQGLNAILNPVPGLVVPEVAQEIIRFVGRPSAEHAFLIGDDAAEGLEVEPSLLSLVCRELNERRIARGLDQIGADLLAGSRDDIIAGFYERCLSDQPAALRAFVEDRLLSESGFRESITLDSARLVLSDNGVPEGALDELVRQRLLRVEERLDIPRVEIIHDVLIPVIRKSRDTRPFLSRAEAIAAELGAALRREKRRAKHAYWLATVMTVLALLTMGLVGWGWRNSFQAGLYAREIAQLFRTRAATEVLHSKTRNRNKYIEGIELLLGTFAYLSLHLTENQLVDAEWLQHLFQENDKLADVLRNEGDVSAALVEYRAALGIAEQLVQKSPANSERQVQLFTEHNKVGEVLEGQGDPSGAVVEYRASLEIAKGLAEKDPGNTDWQHEISIGHISVGDVFNDQGELAAALAEYRAGLDIAQGLADKDPGRTEWQRDVIVNHFKVGDILREQNELPAALTEYRSSLAMAQYLAEKEKDNPQWEYGPLYSYERIGLLAYRKHEFPAALDAFERAEEIALDLKKIYPSAASSTKNLTWVQTRLEETRREIAGSAGAVDQQN
jgi:tetratricopeptide (TPR) repeat protein